MWPHGPTSQNCGRSCKSRHVHVIYQDVMRCHRCRVSCFFSFKIVKIDNVFLKTLFLTVLSLYPNGNKTVMENFLDPNRFCFYAEALKEVAEIATQLQSSLIRLENFQKLTELQRDLIGIENLTAPGRVSAMTWSRG